MPDPVIEESGDGFSVIFYRKITDADQKVSSNKAVAISIDQKMGSETEVMGSADQNVGSNFATYKALLLKIKSRECDK